MERRHGAAGNERKGTAMKGKADGAKAAGTISRAEAQQQLLDGVAAITDSESFKRYLDVVAKFHRYSANNGLLLLVQGLQRDWESLGHVASYGTWQKLGYQVRKGERALKIWAPLRRTVEDKDTGDKVTFVTGFRVVSVFALPQVDAIAGKAKDLTSGHGAAHKLETAERADLYAIMQAVAVHMGATFAEEDTMRGEGYYQPATKKIAVRAGNAVDMKAKTLTHEVAHHADALLGTLKMSDYADGEQAAEGAAYIICRTLGLDTSAYSFNYVAHWGGTPERLVALTGRIGRITRAIFGALDAVAPDIAPADEGEEDAVAA